MSDPRKTYKISAYVDKETRDAFENGELVSNNGLSLDSAARARASCLDRARSLSSTLTRSGVGRTDSLVMHYLPAWKMPHVSERRRAGIVSSMIDHPDGSGPHPWRWRPLRPEKEGATWTVWLLTG